MIVQKKKSPNRGEAGTGSSTRLSLYPLTFDEAVSDLLKVKPERRQATAPKKQREKRGHKQ
jgi:hypothetical protein